MEDEFIFDDMKNDARITFIRCDCGCVNLQVSIQHTRLTYKLEIRKRKKEIGCVRDGERERERNWRQSKIKGLVRVHHLIFCCCCGSQVAIGFVSLQIHQLNNRY